MLNIYSRPQASEPRHPARPSLIEIHVVAELSGHHHGHTNLPGVARIRSRKALLTDADNRVRVAVDGELLPDYIRIAREPRLPESVTQDCYWMCALKFIVVGGEQSPQRRSHAENRKIISRNHFTRHTLGSAVITQAHVHFAEAKHSAERRVVVAEVLIHWIRNPVPSLIAAVVSPDCAQQSQLFGLLHGQRAHQNLIGQGKNCCVRPDPKCERKHCYGNEKRRFGKGAERKAD